MRDNPVRRMAVESSLEEAMRSVQARLAQHDFTVPLIERRIERLERAYWVIFCTAIPAIITSLAALAVVMFGGDR